MAKQSTSSLAIHSANAWVPVSESTVRRDLEALEDSGHAKRTHGGVFYTGASPKLPHFDQLQPANWD